MTAEQMKLLRDRVARIIFNAANDGEPMSRPWLGEPWQTVAEQCIKEVLAAGSVPDQTEHVSELRAIAERIHCPDTRGGKVAAAIKADILALATRMETPERTDPTKPTYSFHRNPEDREGLTISVFKGGETATPEEIDLILQRLNRGDKP